MMDSDGADIFFYARSASRSILDIVSVNQNDGWGSATGFFIRSVSKK
jgi:hypothetical protein